MNKDIERLRNIMSSVDRQLENSRNTNESLSVYYEQLENELNELIEVEKMKRYGIMNINYYVENDDLRIMYATNDDVFQYSTKCYSVDQMKLCISEFRNHMSSEGYKE